MNSEIATATSLRELKELLEQLTDEESKALDWSDLPLFSDDEPRDTEAVWSYDATHQLEGVGRPLQIQPRPDKVPIRRPEFQ